MEAEKKTEEGELNEIAKFMGWKFIKWCDGNIPMYQRFGAEGVLEHPGVFHSPKYETWNSLMTVVEKIRSLGFRVEIDMGVIDTDVHITKGEERLNIAYYSNPKECVYTAVVQFIQWHNNQIKQ